MEGPIVFKVEHSLWESLEDGTRSFDMRWWDIADDRIYALAWAVPDPKAERPFFTAVGYEPVRHQGAMAQGFKPEVERVSFRDKETDEVLTFQYRGVVFPDWAPGWGFLMLGDRVFEGAKEESGGD